MDPESALRRTRRTRISGGTVSALGRLGSLRARTVATVIYHSIVLPYFDSGERDRFGAAVRAAGERARESGPLAWISMEPLDDDPSVVELVCRTWPNGRSVRLARTTPHGTRVRWEPAEESAR